MLAQSAGVVEYANRISTEGQDTTPTSDLYMTSSDGEASTLELWGMWSTSLLPLVPSPLYLRMVIPVRLYGTKRINHLTVCKQKTDITLNC